MRKFLLVSLPVYLLLLWLVSGVSRGSGVVIFAGGVAAWLGCVALLRWHWRRPLFALYLLALLLAASVGSVELALRLAPNLLSGALANYAYSGYHPLPGGIYFRDDHYGFAMRPCCTRTMYWNGHWWQHEANAAGYRGPLLDQADAVFLGDSMIYGHGVEADHTVAAHFQRLSGLTSANLGQQGTCLLQSWLRLRDLGLALRPRWVFVCCHPNDIDEASAWYPLEQLNRFIAAPVDDDFAPTVHRHYRGKSLVQPDHLWNEFVAPPLRLAGALHGLVRVRGADSTTLAPISAARNQVPPSDVLEAPFAPWKADAPERQRLGWAANVHALARMHHLCRRNGATLIVLDMGYSREFSAAIEAETRRLGAVYSPAGRVALERALAGEDVYLANDGHWSSGGHAVIAGELLRLVER